MKKGLFLLMILTATFYGCATSMGPKETGGTVVGGVGGAIIGSQVGGGTGQLVGVAIGTLAGALIGQEVGRSLDKADRVAMENSTHQALEYNQSHHSSTWRNPDNGHSGTTTPTRTYKEPDGRYCREYTQTVLIEGEQHKAYGTACRRPDGNWEIVK
jgi:surface antigen